MFGRLRPSLAITNSDKLRPNSPKPDTDLTGTSGDVDRCWPDTSGRTRPMPAEIAQALRPASAEHGPSSLEFGPKSANFGAKSALNRPSSVQFRPMSALKGLRRSNRSLGHINVCGMAGPRARQESLFQGPRLRWALRAATEPPNCCRGWTRVGSQLYWTNGEGGRPGAALQSGATVVRISARRAVLGIRHIVARTTPMFAGSRMCDTG